MIQDVPAGILRSQDIGKRVQLLIQANLPGFLCPFAAATLARLGRDNDGGYLVDSRDVAAADSLISLGLFDDWSFDEAFVRQNPVPVLAYDGSIGWWTFARRIVKALLVPGLPPGVQHNTRLLTGYLSFFSGRNRHIRRFVSRDRKKSHVTMMQVFETALALGFSRPFLKIDIEGSEYGILKDLVRCASSTVGLVIEFHDCDAHLEEIREFVAAYPLRLAHIHANNCGVVNSDQFPVVLELTFSSSSGAGNRAALPHHLDMPNNASIPEIALSFTEAA
jgi:hypothetical protein